MGVSQILVVVKCWSQHTGDTRTLSQDQEEKHAQLAAPHAACCMLHGHHDTYGHAGAGNTKCRYPVTDFFRCHKSA